MNGAHDLGGQMGFGPVDHEADEPHFHEPWEARVLGLNILSGGVGGWNIDQSRSAREALHPVTYLSATYYEVWLRGLTKLLARAGLVSAAEIRAGRPLAAAPGGVRAALTAAQVRPMLRRGRPCDRPVEHRARFAVGDAVHTINEHPVSHTRLPRYARGRVGVVEMVHGAHVYPDSSALGAGDDPQWLYTVRFDGRELWGPGCDPSLSVSIDAWEPYLRPAEEAT